jgi:asparagine synthetase B (glutamine-hydrolysing)
MISVPDVLSYLGKATARRGSQLASSATNDSGEVGPAEAPDVLVGPALSSLSEPDLVFHVRSAVQGSINRLASSYERPALLLSGGFDSTLLAVLLRRVGVQPRCYVVTQSGVALGADERHAQAVAASLGLSCTVVSLNNTLISSALQLLHENSAAPLTCWSAVNQLVATQIALRDNCDVVVSGTGSDELFGGYHKIGRYGSRFEELAESSSVEETWQTLLGPPSVGRQYLLYIGQCCPFPAALLRKLFPTTFFPGLLSDDVVDLYRALHSAHPDAPYSALIFQLELALRTTQVLVRDFSFASSLGGLPTAFPFLDQHLLTSVAKLPMQYRYTLRPSSSLRYRPPTKAIDKHILRLAFQDEVPAFVQTRWRHTYTLSIRPWWSQNNHKNALVSYVMRSSLWQELECKKPELRAVLEESTWGDHWRWPFRKWVLFQLARWRESL